MQTQTETVEIAVVRDVPEACFPSLIPEDDLTHQRAVFHFSDSSWVCWHVNLEDHGEVRSTVSLFLTLWEPEVHTFLHDFLHRSTQETCNVFTLLRCEGKKLKPLVEHRTGSIAQVDGFILSYAMVTTDLPIRS